MTDRIHALTVTLERDTREDDVECVLSAIRMVKGVAAVSPHVAGSSTWIARERVRNEASNALYDAVRLVLAGDKRVLEFFEGLRRDTE